MDTRGHKALLSNRDSNGASTYGIARNSVPKLHPKLKLIIQTTVGNCGWRVQYT